MPVAPPLQPFALDRPSFPYPSLAAAAARAPLGGDREAALACFMLARLAGSLLSAAPLAPGTRSARAAAARAWLSSLALPPNLRAACVRVVECTAGDRRGAAGALDEVTAITAGVLDPSAHSELVRLAQRLRA